MDNTINFDEASKAWRSNKIFNKNGLITYKCTYVYNDGKRCSKPILNNKIDLDCIKKSNYFCKQHNSRNYDENINIWS